jgi:hypothetical protein
MVLVLGCCVVARTDSRPCVVRRPSMVAGYFLLLAQKKVTKEKAPSRSRFAGHPCPANYARTRRASPGAHPCAEVELAGILPAIAVATFPPPARRGREGTREEQSAAVPAADAPDIYDIGYIRHVGFFALLFGSPLSSGEGRTEKPRAPHAGGARDRADFDNRPWMACGRNPSARSEPSPLGEGANPRVPFSLVTFFWASKRK